MGRCHLPPGREAAIMGALPIIPPGLAPDFLSRGEWPHGIQQGLDLTRDCPWADDMAQFTTSSVALHSGEIVVVDPAVLGLLNPGWYRRWLAGQAPVPRDPTWTLAQYQHEGGATRSSDPEIVPFPEVPVPTIDLPLPWPYGPMPSQWIGRQTGPIAPGALGIVWMRLPGSSHPLFSTGLGIAFVVREWMSPIGMEYLDYLASFPPGQPGIALPGSYLVAPWSSAYHHAELVLSPMQFTRDYAASHMQRPRPRNVGGEALAYRWRQGGTKPSAGTPQAADVFEVRGPGLLGGSTWTDMVLNVRQAAFDRDGRSRIDMAPEAPFGRFHVHGPAPGTFRDAA